jgi:hypothetical protein
MPLFKSFAVNCDAFSIETVLGIVYKVRGEVRGLIQTIQVKFALLNHKNTSQICKSWTRWDIFPSARKRVAETTLLENFTTP